MSKGLTDCFISFGSNLGDRRENIQKALRLLKKNSSISIEKISSIIETDPVGGPAGQKKYLNGVVQIKTSLSADRLLDYLQYIEKQLGRIRKIKDGPRTIDLDILLFGKQRIHTCRLKVPHPKMYKREFVMGPLREISEIGRRR